MKTVYPALIGLIVFLVYYWGINGQFQFDDHPNIVMNERLHINAIDLESITKAALSSGSGILRRPISMMSFAINHYFSGLNPLSYKLTNVLIHIINCIAIYWLSLLLFNNIKSKELLVSDHTLAFLVSLGWGIHPINLTAVLYVVQRMTSLAALFTICSICFYLKARKEVNIGQTNKGVLYLSLVVIFGILGVLSKENVALLFLFLFIIECILYREEQHSQKYNQILSAFFAIFLIIPVLIAAIYTIITPDWILRGYSATQFSMYERVLTELRIVWMYLYWILLPNNSNLGFFHDDITISTSLLDQTYPVVAGIGHIFFISILAYLWKTKKQPLVILGFSLFYASHLLESTVIPLMLTFEHRNYFGSFGVILAAFSIIFRSKGTSKNIAIIGICAYLSITGFMTAQRAMTWGSGIQNALVDIQNHPNSAAAYYELGRQYTQTNTPNNINLAKLAFTRAAELNTKRAGSLFALLYLSVKNDIPVKQELLDKLNYRLKTSPVYAVNVAWMDTLVKCHLSKACLIKKADIISIIDAALSNIRLDDAKLSKSYFLMTTSLFLVTEGNNYKQALEFSVLAANTSPTEITFTINVINLALSQHDHSTARTWISKLSNSFTGSFTKEVLSMELRLAESIMNDKDNQHGKTL